MFFELNRLGGPSRPRLVPSASIHQSRLPRSSLDGCFISAGDCPPLKAVMKHPSSRKNGEIACESTRRRRGSCRPVGVSLDQSFLAAAREPPSEREIGSKSTPDHRHDALTARRNGARIPAGLVHDAAASRLTRIDLAVSYENSLPCRPTSRQYAKHLSPRPTSSKNATSCCPTVRHCARLRRVVKQLFFENRICPNTTCVRL